MFSLLFQTRYHLTLEAWDSDNSSKTVYLSYKETIITFGFIACLKAVSYTGFVRVLENLESLGILLWHFPGLESPEKWPLVLESAGNLLKSAIKFSLKHCCL